MGKVSDDANWEPTLLRALERLRRRFPNNSFRVENAGEEGCPTLEAGACFGRQGLVACDEGTLIRVLKSIAWSTAGDTRDSPEESFHPLDLDAALTLAGAPMPETDEAVRDLGRTLSPMHPFTPTELGSLSRFIEKMLQLESTSPAAPPTSPADRSAIALSIYQAATDYVLAYVIGHELTHAFGRIDCALDARSDIEENGVLSRIYGIQRSGPLCPSRPSFDEERADLCGLRVVQAVDATLMTPEAGLRTDAADVPSRLTEARRLAIDVMAWLLPFGLNESAADVVVPNTWVASDGLPIRAHVISDVEAPGYLYPPLRVLAFANLMRAREPFQKFMVNLCDISAQNVAMLVHAERMYCRTNEGEEKTKTDFTGLSDAFRGLMPPGVITSWERNGRHEDRQLLTFVCPTEPKDRGIRVEDDALYSTELPQDESAALTALERACAKGGNASACTTVGIYRGRGGATFERDPKLAAERFRTACEGGDGKGCILLAAMTGTADGVERNVAAVVPLFERGMTMLRSRCSSNGGEECVDLGIMLVNGREGRFSSTEGMEFLASACAAGNLRGCYAHALATDSDTELDAACQKGFARACAKLGEPFVRFGDAPPLPHGLPVDYAQKACDLGSSVGCYYQVETTKWTPANAELINSLFAKACAGGYSPGCVDWGNWLEDGPGGPKDAAQALRLYERACSWLPSASISPRAALADSSLFTAPGDAAQILGNTSGYAWGTPYGCDLVAKARHARGDYRGAIDVLKKACTFGSARACGHLGLYFRDGLGVEQDMDKAVTYLGKGCTATEKKPCEDLRQIRLKTGFTDVGQQ